MRTSLGCKLLAPNGITLWSLGEGQRGTGFAERNSASSSSSPTLPSCYISTMQLRDERGGRVSDSGAIALLSRGDAYERGRVDAPRPNAVPPAVVVDCAAVLPKPRAAAVSDDAAASQSRPTDRGGILPGEAELAGSDGVAEAAFLCAHPPLTKREWPPDRSPPSRDGPSSP